MLPSDRVLNHVIVDSIKRACILMTIGHDTSITWCLRVQRVHLGLQSRHSSSTSKVSPMTFKSFYQGFKLTYGSFFSLEPMCLSHTTPSFEDDWPLEECGYHSSFQDRGKSHMSYVTLARRGPQGLPSLYCCPNWGCSNNSGLITLGGRLLHNIVSWCDMLQALFNHIKPLYQ